MKHTVVARVRIRHLRRKEKAALLAAIAPKERKEPGVNEMRQAIEQRWLERPENGALRLPRMEELRQQGRGEAFCEMEKAFALMVDYARRARK